jgi:hypothetical protein
MVCNCTYSSPKRAFFVEAISLSRAPSLGTRYPHGLNALPGGCRKQALELVWVLYGGCGWNRVGIVEMMDTPRGPKAAVLPARLPVNFPEAW